MPSSYGSLAKDAIALLDRFSAGRQCLDDFLEDVSENLQNRDPRDRKFILDAVSGCVEHKQLLDVVVNLFYKTEECVPKSDLTMYHIICYLTTFSLDELGLKCLGSVAKSLGVYKVQTFLIFFFKNLTTLIRERWNGIYDAEHVEKQWIQPTLRWGTEIMAELEQIAAQVSCGREVRKTPAKTTEPREFALTKPRPRAFPLPEIIPEQEKHKPVPKSTYKAPEERQKMVDLKLKNQQKAERLLYKANLNPFTCVSPQKSKHYQKVVSEIEEDMLSKLKFNSFQSSRLPSTTKQSIAEIKLNSAAILRQGALLDRQLKQELHRMERLVEGAQEPSSFLQWQREMREKDLQEQLARVERRRLEGRISHEEAAMARSRLMAQNQTAAQLKKEETAELMRRYAEKRLQEEKETRDLVQQVAEGHKNSKAAKEKLHAIKQRIVKEVSEQSQELLRRALAEAQAELSRKFEIIREIRALESISFVRASSFDDTETGGHELLGEMSLAELRERLALLKEAQLAQQQERRHLILEQRQRKRQLLQQQLETIHLHQATAGRRKPRGKQSHAPTVTPDETILALQKKLEQKKQERKSLRQSERNRNRTSTRLQTDTEGTSSSVRPKETLAPSHVEMSVEDRDWEQLKRNLELQIQRDSSVTLM